MIAADAAIGIITTASFALGVALISRYRTFTRSFDAALFGNILGVNNNDLYAIIGVTVLTFVAVFVLYKRLLFTTFDPEVAPFFGVDTAWVDTFFSLILAGAIVVSLQVLGATLIAATLVIPPITARLLTDNFVPHDGDLGAHRRALWLHRDLRQLLRRRLVRRLDCARRRRRLYAGPPLLGRAEPHRRLRPCHRRSARATGRRPARPLRLAGRDAYVVAIYLHAIRLNWLRRRRADGLSRPHIELARVKRAFDYITGQ